MSHKETSDVTGTRVEYYVKKLDNNLSNTKHDHYVSLNFDIHNQLVDIDTNIKGLEFGPLTGISYEELARFGAGSE